MKLYYDHPAPNPRIVRIVVAEKNLDIEEERIRIRNREHKREPFLSINPLGELPVLQRDDGSFLTEVTAICRYLEALAPEPSLFGRNAEEQADVEMWRRRAEWRLFFTSAMCYRHKSEVMADLEEQIPAWSELNGRRAKRAHLDFNERLKQSPFLAGETFSIADITAFCGVDFGKFAGLEIDPSLTHLSAWREKTAARPAILKC